MKKETARFSVKWIAYTAMFTALVMVTGFLPAITTPIGRIYWVDGMVLLAAYLMDPLAAFIAGGVGSLIYDVFKSPSMMLPSLLIHGLQGAIVSALLRFVFAKFLRGKKEWVGALVASVIGAAEVVLGYFVYRWVTSGLPVAWTNIPRNILQEAIGIAIGLLICYATTFKRQLAKNRLLPDFSELKTAQTDSGEEEETMENCDEDSYILTPDVWTEEEEVTEDKKE